ncbi:MAG: site-2 protease family protein [Candidatus Krumholzibacteria bacterium]|nr:site-2 protease family protein [Candidatus Krumholzibacteria bacterium]
MVRRSIRLFRLWGIPVELDVSWLFVLVLITWTFATRYYPSNYSGLFSFEQLWILGFLTAIMLFTSILLHEFSHSIVAQRNGLPIKKITLFMFGGVAQMDRDVDDPVIEFKMAAAGPLMTLVLAVIFFSFSVLLKNVVFVSVLFGSLANINLAVLLFNMVPGFPLDGGRILRAAIWYKTKDIRRATRIASRIGSGFAIVLMVLGFFVFIVNGSFIGGLWLIFIGFFLRQAAQSGYLMVTLKQSLGHMRVADIMRTGVVTTDASLDLRSLVDDYFLRYHYGSFPVLKDGELVGIVSLKDVKKVERERWPEATVEDVLDRGIAGLALHPMDSAERLFSIVMRKGYGRFPVVDDNGNIVGIVTRRDLMELIKMTTYLEE